MTQTTRLLVPAAAVMAALLLDGCQASSSGEGDLSASSEGW